MAASSTDPGTWTVPQVGEWVRANLRDMVLAIPNAQCPDPQILSQQLERDGVTGYVLIDIVDLGILRKQYGITDMRELSAMMTVIRRLRAASKVYNELSSAVPPFDKPPRATTAQESACRGRANEYVVEDATGMKRRKLNASALIPVTDEEAQASAAFQVDSIGSPDRNKSRRLDIPRTKPQYLRDQGLNLDQLIFGDTQVGEEIKDHDDDNDDLNHFADPFVSYGEANFVGRRMKCMYNDLDTQTIMYKGNLAKVRQPYHAPKRPKKDTFQEQSRLAPSVMVVSVPNHGDEPTAYRENAWMLPHLQHAGAALPASLTDEPPGEWDYLRYKHLQLPEEEVISVASVSADEETAEPDDDHSETSSDGENMVEDTEDASILSKERVLEVIQEAISSQAQHWHATKAPKLWERKAWKLWRDAQAGHHHRAALIASSENEASRLTSRRDKLIESLVDQQWTGETNLQGVCANLEQTIFSIEEEAWKRGIWKSKEEPPRPAKPAPRKHSKGARDTRSTGHRDMDELDDSIVSDAVIGGEQPLKDSMEDSASPIIVPPSREASTDHELTQVGQDQSSGLDPGRPSSNTPPPQTHDADVSPVKTPPTSQGRHVSSQDFESPALPSMVDIDQLVRSTQEQRRCSSEVLIDLTSSDHESRSPVKTVKVENPIKTKSKFTYSNNPLKDPDYQVFAWEYEELESEGDQIRILLKLAYDMSPATRRRLLNFLSAGNMKECFRDINEACSRLPDEPSDVWPYTGRTLEESQTILDAAKLFCVYWCTDHTLWRASPIGFEESVNGRPDATYMPALRSFHICAKSALQKAESSRKPILLSSDSDEDIESPVLAASRRRRHRGPKIDERSTAIRERALARKFVTESTNTTDSPQRAMYSGSDLVVIYAPQPSENCEPVYLPTNLPRPIKPHQIDGIRFLWREITEKQDGQGCVLAHAMGLGKTAQSIVLLYIIAEVRRSPPRHCLLPEEFLQRNLHVLIICMPILINNWRREIDEWSRGAIGETFLIDTAQPPAARVENLEDWDRGGGIMLIGYDMFRNMVNAKPRFSVVEQEEVRRILLHTPSIVIADEAHIIRNEKSATSKAAQLVSTHRRIALTGTPMSNNTQEIYSLISWVAPGYLGSKEEFRSQYAIPIEEGSYVESTAYERRRSLKKLAALNYIISPKLDRKDITALRGLLKPKVEFVLTVPLTNHQAAAYQKYIEVVAGISKDGDGNDYIPQTRLFGLLGVLCLLCCHPDVYRRKLIEKRDRGAEFSRRDTSNPMSNNIPGLDIYAGRHRSPSPILAEDHVESSEAADLHVSKIGLTENMITKLLQDLPDQLEDLRYSYKTILVNRIIKLALQAGDKVLIFSHSMPSLEFLQRMLQADRIRFGVIRGETAPKQRQDVLRRMSNGEIEVLILSTRTSSLGLNIQEANRVIIFDFGFNPTWEEQAIARAYRLGQEKPVFVYRFVAGGTFEYKLYNKALFKTSLASRVVDKKNPMRNARRNAKEWLQPPSPVYQEDISGEKGKDPAVLDVILAEQIPGHSYIGATSTMETLQAEDRNDLPLTEEEHREVLEDVKLSAGRKLRSGRTL